MLLLHQQQLQQLIIVMKMEANALLGHASMDTAQYVKQTKQILKIILGVVKSMATVAIALTLAIVLYNQGKQAEAVLAMITVAHVIQVLIV